MASIVKHFLMKLETYNASDTIDYANLNYGNTNDIGVGSIGILKLAIFTGSHKNPKYSHDEYYKVEVISDNYTSDYTHRFTVKVLDVLKGTSKKVGSTFWKQGKNFYSNYYELQSADAEVLNKKHKRKDSLIGQGMLRNG